MVASIASLLANGHTAYAMTFRQKFSIGALAFLLAALALLIFPEKPEPNWEGRKLGEWLQTAGKYKSLSSEFEEVVQAVETNGIPFYTKWMRYEPGLLTRAQYKLGALTPGWLPFKRAAEDTKLQRMWGALFALRVLGGKAEPAVPHLYAWATNDTERDVRILPAQGYPMDLLARIGGLAVPAYLCLITNADARVRAMALSTASLTNLFNNESVTAQIKQSLADPDARVRISATNAWSRHVAWKSTAGKGGGLAP